MVSGKLNADGTNAALLPKTIDFSWFPLDNPGIVSIPLGFFFGWLGTVTSKEVESEAAYDEFEVRASPARAPSRRPRTDSPSPFPVRRRSQRCGNLRAGILGWIGRNPPWVYSSRTGFRPRLQETAGSDTKRQTGVNVTSETLSNLSHEERRFPPPADLAPPRT